MPPDEPTRDPFLDAVGQLGAPLLRALAGMEHTQRHLHPPRIESLREGMRALRDALREARGEFAKAPVTTGLERFAEQLADAARLTDEAVSLFCDEGPASEGIARVLGSMRAHCRALEALYPLGRALPPIGRFFVEPSAHDRLAQLDPEPADGARVGLHHAHNAPDERGGFSFYAPESCAGDEPRPLVVALHGGSGHGADFLWTWLREAKTRRCFLLAPTARGPTWSLQGRDVDAAPIRAMVEFVSERWPIDPAKVLLTGLSDGATYTLLCGLQPDGPFTALAPVSGVLHPSNFGNGNLGRARGVPIYLAHGALDWMFPVAIARMAADELERAGAALAYHEIEDLSHAYPREHNARILEWLDPSLALDAPAGAHR